MTSDTDTTNAIAERLVDATIDAICALVRAVCMGDRTIYRDLLERVAQRLGDV